MLSCYQWSNLSAAEKKSLLFRPVLSSSATLEKTQAIIEKVRQEGDAALQHFTQLFDGVTLSSLCVTDNEKKSAFEKITPELKHALQTAMKHIETYHRAQKTDPIVVNTAPGITCTWQSKPIAHVGLYIPGGTAPLPSTVLMLGVPAQVAGCSLKILCTPPNKNGEIDPSILVAAQLCGIENIYKVGGAQAIAAMAYGTDTIPKVDKIFGPGNSWVTQAKYAVAGDPQGAAFDLPAGPSEVLVIADDDADPDYVAADLLSQAEHGVDSQVIVICLSQVFAERVQSALVMQLEHLPRKNIAEQALQHSRCFIVDDIPTAIEISNAYAPEHLILQINNAAQYVDAIEHAGSVFVGSFTPESVGDYASGTNHVLPTYGYARAYGGLSLKDFMKTMSIQSLTREGLSGLSPTVIALAEAEGLHAHANAVRCRLISS